MKVKNRKIFTIIILFVMLAIVSTSTFATLYSPDAFKSKIDTTGTGTNKVKTVGGEIVGLIQIVGTIVAVGMLIVLGIKYMMGSAEERAEYKKTALPYIIGAVLIFAASNLAQVIYTWATAL